MCLILLGQLTFFASAMMPVTAEGEDTASGARRALTVEMPEDPTVFLNQNWPEDGAFIVKVKPGSNSNVIDKAQQKANGYIFKKRPFQVKHNFESTDGLNAVVIEGVKKGDLRLFEEVVSIEPDLFVRKAELASTWGLDRINQIDMPLDDVYSPDYYGCGVDVYIVDTGIDTLHKDFQGGLSRVVQNIYNVYGAITANTDGDGHGTHVAGTVGGYLAGVSRCANLYGMKALDDTGGGSISNIIAALNIIKSRHLANPGAKTVINMSIGAGCASGGCVGDSLIAKIEELSSVGIISSVAAGNANVDCSSTTPAAAVNAITVAASDIIDAKGYFSSYGSLVDLFAPGVSIPSACSSLITGCSAGTNYIVYSGTSMAAPHVSGAIAQILERTSLQMTTLQAVQDIKAQLVCDSAKNKITGVPAGTTTNVLNIIRGASTLCLSNPLPTRAPTQAPSGPTNAPTFAPTVRPSTTKPSAVPTAALGNGKPTRKPR